VSAGLTGGKRKVQEEAPTGAERDGRERVLSFRPSGAYVPISHGFSAQPRGRIRRAIALEDAGRVRHNARWCNCWDELTATAVAVPADLAIIDPFHPAPSGNELASFARRFPNVGFIGYGDFAGRPAADVVALVRMGVSAVLTLEVDHHPVGIGRVMAQGTTPQAFRPVCRSLPHCSNVCLTRRSSR
jgi:hypothetical protein